MQVFLDTNVFLYAAGSAHPQRDPCAKVLARVADGSIDATTNAEVIQEILYVLTRRGSRSAALTLSGAVLALFPEILPITREEIQAARGLLKQYPRLTARDAIHAASMIRSGVLTIVSVDSDFDTVSEIRRTEPRLLVK